MTYGYGINGVDQSEVNFPTNGSSSNGPGTNNFTGSGARTITK